MIELNATLALVTGTNGKNSSERATKDMKGAFDAALSLLPEQRAEASLSHQGVERFALDLPYGRSAFHIMYAAQTNTPSFVSAPDIAGTQPQGILNTKPLAEVQEQATLTDQVVEPLNDGLQSVVVADEIKIDSVAVDDKPGEGLLSGLPDTSGFVTPTDQTSSDMSARIAVLTSDTVAAGAHETVTRDTSSAGTTALEPKASRLAPGVDAKVENTTVGFESKSLPMQRLPSDTAQILAPAKPEMIFDTPVGQKMSAFGPATSVSHLGDGVLPSESVSTAPFLAFDRRAAENALMHGSQSGRGIASDMGSSHKKQDALPVEKIVGAHQAIAPGGKTPAVPEQTFGSQITSSGLKSDIQGPNAVLPTPSISPSQTEAWAVNHSSAPLQEATRGVDVIDKAAAMRAPSQASQFPEKRAPQALVEASSDPTTLQSPQPTARISDVALLGGVDTDLRGLPAERFGRATPQRELRPSDVAETMQVPVTRTEAGSDPKVPGAGLKFSNEGLSLGSFPRDVTLRELRPTADSTLVAGTDAMSSSGPAALPEGAMSVSTSFGPASDRRVSLLERSFLREASAEVSNSTGGSVYDVRDALSQSGSSATAPAASIPLAVAQFAPMLANELKDGGSVESDALLAMQATAEIVSASSRASDPTARSPVPMVPPEVLKIAEQLRTGIRMDRYPLEIALDPPELGQVRMVLQTGEVTTTLLIIADRPETADLMRRNASFLHDAFAQEGKGGLNLQFGTSADADRGSAQGGRSENLSAQAVGAPASGQGAEPQSRISPSGNTSHSRSTSGLNLTF